MPNLPELEVRSELVDERESRADHSLLVLLSTSERLVVFLGAPRWQSDDFFSTGRGSRGHVKR